MLDTEHIKSDFDSLDELDFVCYDSPEYCPLLDDACCLRCRDVRPLERIYRLCKPCIKECLGDHKQEKFWLRGAREQPELPTLAPPGSLEKIEVLGERVLRGEELFGAEDAAIPVDWSKVDVSSMLADPIMRDAGKTGVERDGDNWRARPSYRGTKRNLGMFRNEQDAIDAVVEFWREVFNLGENATLEDFEEARRLDDQIVIAERERADHERRVAIDLPLFPNVLDGSQQAV